MIGKRRRVARGIYRDRYGYEVRVQVKGLPERTHFGPDTPHEEMKDWQDAARRRLRKQARARPAGPFAEDAARYLKYDLRHSFGSLVYATTHDLAATAVLLGHASLTTSRRYTLTAVPAALRDAVAKIEANTGQKRDPAA